MEAIGTGLEAIGDAVSSIAGWAGMFGIVGIVAITFLMYTKTISLDDIKSIFTKDKRYR